MLKPTVNCVDQLTEPDVDFDWDAIEQVLVSSSQVKTCAICLSWPTAARVTPCGHIFCLPCILHYLQVSVVDRCPLCCWPVCKQDLKLAKVTQSLYQSHVELALVQRTLPSTLAFPVSETWPMPERVTLNYIKPDVPLIPWSHMPLAKEFARFMLANPDDLLTKLEQDLRELDRFEPDSEERPFVEEGIQTAIEQKKRLELEKTEEMTRALEALTGMYEAVARYSRKHSPEKKDDTLYFYQACNGEALFLHPSDIRMLRYEFGEYSEFPHKLSVKIVDAQECTLDEIEHKKYRWLSHLPLNCDVRFLNIDIESVVSEKTKLNFQKELNARQDKYKK